MTDRAMFETLRRGWRRFCRAQRGNVTITFGLAFIPLVGLTGAAA